MIEIHVEGRIRVTTLSGQVTGDELIRASVANLRGPDYDPTLVSLVDLRAVTSIDFGAADVTSVAGLYSEVRKGAPQRMAVVGATPVALGYSRAFEIQGGAEVRQFATMEEARNWLAPDSPRL